MSMRGTVIVPAALAAALATLAVVAHPDDPKERDRVPPYDGPGYRRDLDGGVAGGPPINFPSSNVELLSWIPAVEFGAGQTSANSCTGYVSPSGREYAIIGLSGGTGFAEVTNPGNAQIVALIPGPGSIWRDMRTYQNYCYAVSEGGQGIQVMNLANIDNGVVTLVGTVTTGGTQATHTMTINPASGYLYRAGGGANGLRFYSLANPANPSYVGSWSDIYVHEVTVITYTSGPYAGKEIAFCCGGANGGHSNTGLYVLDVTNKASIVELDEIHYANARYCHQGWPSQDRSYFYINDELDESQYGVSALTRIINIQNLSNLFEAGSFTSGAGAIDHNLYVNGNLIFESNYRSGLRVFDNSNPTAPVQIAYFDTWPEDNNASFNGLWNNYPYLPSGTVIGSDIEKGLFVWRIGPPLLAFSHPEGLPTEIDPAGDTVRIAVEAINGGAIDPRSVTLNVTAGTTTSEVPMTPVGGDLYEADFPPVDCPMEVLYSFTARTNSGLIYQDPPGYGVPDYAALAAYGLVVAEFDNMETDTGWTVGAPGDAATAGIWERVDPNPTIAQPGDDNPDGTGTMCWITAQNTDPDVPSQNDVDGGPTTLTSPVFDATGGEDPRLVYYRWYSNDTGGCPGEDSMPVLASNNGGASWITLETVTESDVEWVRREYLIEDLFTPTDQIRLRFIVSDFGCGSTVEAGVDDVQIVYYNCTPPAVPGDLTGDGLVTVADLLALLAAWGSCPGCPADFDGNDAVDVNDLLFLLAQWT